MIKRNKSRLKKLGVFTVAQANDLGVRPTKPFETGGQRSLKRVGRGIYLHLDAELDQNVGFQIAFAKFGPTLRSADSRPSSITISPSRFPDTSGPLFLLKKEQANEVTNSAELK